jgi:hypothetical protein
MTQVGCGPLTRIDGPLPVRPKYGLLQAAEAPAAGVTLVTDTDAGGVERWVGGVEVYPYPPGPAHTFNTNQPTSGSDSDVKDEGSATDTSQFGSMAVYLGENCTAAKIWNQEQFKQRARLAFEAVEGAAVAREFLTGDDLTLNPHLADGEGTFPNGDTTTSAINGVALLEEEIAASGKMGLIHMPPQVLTFLASQGMGFDRSTGVWRTPNGNVVIPDSGYIAQARPAPSHAAANGTQNWIYATGPVEIRRSALEVLPDNVAEATDRSINKIVYRVERYYLVTWDTEVQAAVRIDRCQSTC